MFLERKGDVKLDQKDKVMIGYDLSNDYAQISYQSMLMEEPETAALVMGTEIYNIPLVLYKRKGVNQWFFGREALKFEENDGGTLVTGILQAAIQGEKIEIEEQMYEAIALLTLFIKRSLSLVGMVATIEQISSLMFTVDDLSQQMVDMLEQVAANLDLKHTTIYLQNHMESIFHYMMYQNEDLWRQRVIVCDYDGIVFHKYTMVCNQRTVPIVVLIEKEVVETMILPTDLIEEEKPSVYSRLDAQLQESMTRSCKEGIVSTVFFVGEGFRDNWMERTIRYLCPTRRVFIGNNLFSKGACYTLKDKVIPGEKTKKHVFLGQEKLKANVGLEAIKQGKETYFALLDAGNNWYELEKTMEFYMPEDGMIRFLITPLDGKRPINEEIKLDHIPERPAGCTRVRMFVKMNSVNEIQVRMIDMGFGEIFPATEEEWNFIIKV